MRLRELTESPIGDIHTYGKMDGSSGSLRPNDQLIVNSPRAQEKIKRVLFNIPINVELHFVNHTTSVGDMGGGLRNLTTHLNANSPSPNPHLYQKVGFFTPEEFHRTYKVNLNYKPNTLNLVYVENEGGGRMQLSPWIIAHRLYHALDYAGRGFTTDLRKMMAEQLYEFDANLRELGSCYYYSSHPLLMSNSGLRILIASMLKTKAGRENNLTNQAEFLAEIFAQFCITGKITINSPPTELQIEDLKYWIQNQQRWKYATEKFYTFVKSLESQYLKMLKDSVGKILVL